jgi:GTP-binding protein
VTRPGIRIEVLGNLRRPEDTPDVVRPVVAVAGRSNVGKSTLLNALLGRHHLLRTSRTPGCTRSIQLVAVDSPEGAFVLADLPGYGYAALSKERRESWGPLIEGFLRRTRRLAVVLMLMDVRRGPEKEEQALLEFVESIGIEPIVVLTKADKLPRAKHQDTLQRLRKRLAGLEMHITAGEAGEGVDAVWKAIVRRLKHAPAPRRTARDVAPVPPARGGEDMAADPHRETFDRARKAATAGKHDEAIARCNEILAADPRHRGALDLLGFAYFFKQEYSTAEGWCRKTLEHYPQHAYAHKGLGLCLARQGKLEEGLPHLREAMRLEPKFFDPYWDTAVVLREAGRNAEALEILRRGIEQCPERAPRAKALLEELERRAALG